MPRVKTATKEHAILEAASRVFSRKPFHAVLIDEIAADAGTGKGTIYRYFETKEDLHFATTLHVLDGLAAVLSAALPQERSATGRLRRIAAENLRYYWDRRYLFPFLHNYDRSDRQSDLMERREGILRFVQEAILEGIEQRELRGIDARVGAELFLGMVRSANLFRRPDDTLEELVRQIMSVFLEGVAQRGASEVAQRGASEVAQRGASEVAQRGASDPARRGASDPARRGASDPARRGA